MAFNVLMWSYSIAHSLNISFALTKKVRTFLQPMKIKESLVERKSISQTKMFLAINVIAVQ